VPTLLFRGLGLDFGVFQIASPFDRIRNVYRPLTEIHELASYLMIALAAGHALAAVYHQLVARDRLLRRMLPRARG
jgi:cytochrome b561